MTRREQFAVCVGATTALTTGFLLGHTLTALAIGVVAATLTQLLNEWHLAEQDL